MKTEIVLPHNTLLVISGSVERSLFAKINLPPERLVSLLSCQKMLSDESRLPPQNMALDIFYKIIESRLELGFFTAVDIPHLSEKTIQRLLELCNRHYFEPAIVEVVNKNREIEEESEERDDLISYSSRSNLGTLYKRLEQLGFQNVWILTKEDLLYTSLKLRPISAYCHIPPPYDIIGDVHGCLDELLELFHLLGYRQESTHHDLPNSSDHSSSVVKPPKTPSKIYLHPAGRMPIFIGDIADRGPKNVKVIELVLNMVESGKALYIPGNHCVKLMRYLTGTTIEQKYGVEVSIKELQELEEEYRKEISTRFIALVENSPYYLILDNGRLVITHGGIKEKMIGREHRKIRSFCLFGATTGRKLENGLPERLDWAMDYRGKSLIVYGHTPVNEPEFRFNTINIDQGCVFGGALTALRYPEMELVSIKARKTYYCRMK